MDERNYYLEDIPLDEAQARLLAALARLGKDQPLAGEAIPLTEALGRITAEPMWAKISAPSYHASAMDGYAVRASDTLNATETRPVTLELNHQAVPVNTGEALPPFANAVIMIEEVQHPNENQIIIYKTVTPWQHVRMMGEDMVATELVLPMNHRLRPVDLGALAGCGHHTALVRRQPLVIIIPTGSELIPPSQVPQAGQIIEYNSLVLAGQMQEAGARVEIMPIQPDDKSKLQTAIQSAQAQKPDLMLMLSGSSAGSKDFTSRMIADLGELLVHGVAVRPGHPVIMGIVGQIPIIGIPGYPVSAALTGEIFVQALISHWLGQPSILKSRPRLDAVSTRKIQSPMGDDDFIRVTLAQVGEKLLATPLNRGAGVITSLVKADGLAHIPRFSEGVDLGQTLEVMLYRSEKEIRQALLIMGSHDPMLDLLAQFLMSHQQHLSSGHVGSMGGLVALKRGEAHLAGSHLLDEDTGEYNISYIQKYLPHTPLKLITFAHREQGLIVPKNNPAGVQGLADVARLRYVNRQRGTGTRVLLDYELKKLGISPEQIQGYEHEEYTHLAVAAAVKSGVAETGLGLRSAAVALDLDFVSVGWERYDFILPTEHENHRGIGLILDLLEEADFRRALAAQAGYDIRETGKLQYQQ